MRTPVVAGNWKMNKDQSGSLELARGVAAGVRDMRGVDIVVAPVSLYLAGVASALKGTNVAVSAQNMHWAEHGAYTGENSPTMLQDVGCGYAIIGHSERREYFFETDEMVNQKVRSALSHDLTPILCIGETLEEREAGKTISKVDFQVRAALSGVSHDDAPKVVIAYEPIWAIGTGRTATPEQAQEVHAQIRKLLGELYGPGIAQQIRVLYGGSVKADNIAELISQTDIDGALVGGASLSVESFVAIARACAR
ncbi:MAG: triose-phosphate isomerase [bacterium]